MVLQFLRFAFSSGFQLNDKKSQVAQMPLLLLLPNKISQECKGEKGRISHPDNSIFHRITLLRDEQQQHQLMTDEGKEDLDLSSHLRPSNVVFFVWGCCVVYLKIAG